MGYLHIPNLSKDSRILQFNVVYAMEKIHGTSAHIAWKDEKIRLFHGGAPREQFEALFDLAALEAKLREEGFKEVIIFGEAYGGKVFPFMNTSYGKTLKFVAFDVKINGQWVVVPFAERVATVMGLDFVPYVKTSTALENVDALRDAGSRQAVKLGLGEGQLSEGIVLRPIAEFMDQSGERIIAKHKSAAFSERSSKKDTKVRTPEEKLAVLTKADEIANEWVTDIRLDHVLSKVGGLPDYKHIPVILDLMTEDVLREAKDEIKESKEAIKAIKTRTVALFKHRIERSLYVQG